MELAGQVAVVVGLARSGVAAARFLQERGARVVATDSKGAGELEAQVLSLAGEGIRLELGGHRETTILGADLVVVSPGVPWDLPPLLAARHAGVRVIGELELGARFMRGPIAAVTGTKGKSTTTAALGAMLSEAGGEVRVGGNIGAPVTGLLRGATETTVFVLEVSSFQLEGTFAFHPKVSVFLNLTPDHLDRHGDFASYASAKARIFRNQGEEDFAVVNRDSPEALRLARASAAAVVTFGAERPEGEGAFFSGGEALLLRKGTEETLFARATLQVPGSHLALDLLAAAVAARLLGASPEAIARAAASFAGLAHVLEPVATIRGVRFVNDSKATNVDAALRSLESFEGGVLLILGGRFKGGDLSLLAEGVKERARLVLAIGEAREGIEKALRGAAPIVLCLSLEEAVQKGYREARPGDTVLLAPACASFDMFRDYAARGDAFKAAVLTLLEQEGSR
jgi:UDP-N-acetylmuramoylalanine--D-glutamate ligase